jgi:hypothetical protein
MPPIYDKPVKELMKQMLLDINATDKTLITRSQVKSWFNNNYPKIKNATIFAHLIRFSVNAPSRIHHNPKPDLDDVFFQIDSSNFRLYNPLNDPSPIYTSSEQTDDDAGPIQSESFQQQNEFAYEKDLQNFLAKNLEAIESGLTLYEDDGIRGIEYPAGNGRRIDILALDKENNFVIIELKVSKGYDRVIGQTQRYMGWIQKNLAESGQQVRGIIVARTITEDLLLSAFNQDCIEFFEYQLSVTLSKIQK